MSPRTSPLVRRRRFLAALFGLYLLVLAFIAFWPSPVDSGSAGSTLRDVLAWLHERGAPGWFNYNFVEFTANILLFVPFGFLGAAYVDRRWIWMVPVAGFCISGCIELGQMLFRPDRFATASDLVANTIGALHGTCLAMTPSCFSRFLRANGAYPKETRKCLSATELLKRITTAKVSRPSSRLFTVQNHKKHERLNAQSMSKYHGKRRYSTT